MLISRTVILHNASNSQMNRQHLAVLKFYCNRSQYDAHTCKKQTQTVSCSVITGCTKAFRGLTSDSNKTRKRN